MNTFFKDRLARPEPITKAEFHSPEFAAAIHADFVHSLFPDPREAARVEDYMVHWVLNGRALDGCELFLQLGQDEGDTPKQAVERANALGRMFADTFLDVWERHPNACWIVARCPERGLGVVVIDWNDHPTERFFCVRADRAFVDSAVVAEQTLRALIEGRGLEQFSGNGVVQ
jgi:hypothetical protein